MSKRTVCLQTQKLYKSYQSKAEKIDVLSGIDFDAFKGETISVIGASGIGKSTFLNILGTLDQPDSGKVFIDGQDVFAFSDDERSRFRSRSIGFVFQFHHLLPEFNALENTMMPLLIQGMRRREAITRAKEILDIVHLSHRLNHRVTELSGGEQQRVAVARALIHHPSVLLADEPTGNLDQKSSEYVHSLLKQLNQHFQITLIVVTHNMTLASLMDRCVTLKDGQLIEKV
ncbi:MAG: lipoprotein-releasing system ATP-binding protein [Candidatus Magnetoglobus multicellularis str. Araruama]|uniref:Lipoprotein-releasing system ATP-binding protein n=1 Tax=Candidatus Magnetoglobus multicellularis str. Araruama TaxID=890399 RepID=A0A1V1P5Z4_9BACT|nr:MAG: lipoprotein-releasing system ATP-binding protein [Candidatus Magnetoglobus multicellularis str. Araruama]